MNQAYALSRRQWLAGPASLALGMGCAWAAPPPPRVPLFVGTVGPSSQTLRVLAWLAGRVGLAWDIRPTPWLRAQTLAIAGEGVMFGLSRTPRRERDLQFSVPILAFHTWAVVRRAAPATIRRYADLNGHTVCWARGSSYGESFTRAGWGHMNGLESADDDGALRMAAAGRCRAALITLDSSDPEQAARNPALAEMDQRGLMLVPVALAATSLHFATGHDSRWAWVLENIDEVVAQSRSELQQLRQG